VGAPRPRRMWSVYEATLLASSRAKCMQLTHISSCVMKISMHNCWPLLLLLLS
jgi:hypothetical protein